MKEESEKGLATLQAWQRSIDLAVRIIQEVLPRLPQEEKWALAQQIRRSSQSIPANIAEGFGRFYYQESIRFCYMARGPLEETYSHLTLAYELGYLPEDVFQGFNDEIIELRRLVNGYIAYLKRSKRGANEPGAHSAREDSESCYLTSYEPEDHSTELPDP